MEQTEFPYVQIYPLSHEIDEDLEDLRSMEQEEKRLRKRLNLFSFLYKLGIAGVGAGLTWQSLGGNFVESRASGLYLTTGGVITILSAYSIVGGAVLSLGHYTHLSQLILDMGRKKNKLETLIDSENEIHDALWVNS